MRPYAAAPRVDVSPLAEIEERVKDQAKSISLDLGSAESSQELQTLIDQAIDWWSMSYRNGERAFDLADPAGVSERALRNLVGYGPLEPLLQDDDVWEIMINAPDAIFVRRHNGPSGYHHELFHDDEHVTRTLTKILDDSSTSHRKLDPSEGLQDAQLGTGARLHIVHGDVARGGHTMVNIRKFTGVAFRTLAELVDQDMLTHQAADYLRAAVQSGMTIVFAGAPGAGKTTLLSCCAAELDPALRVVTAEEVFEADIPLPNVASMQTRASRQDRSEIDLRRLVAGFLRMAPDVAIVGEVRDREALPLLLTLSSGVQGFTTIHAGTARQALTRLRFICQLSDTNSEIPMAALNNLVSDSVDLVVHCTRGREGPRVTSILAIEDAAGASDATAFTVTEVFDRAGEHLRWTGEIPVRAGRRLSEAGFDARELLGASRCN